MRCRARRLASCSAFGCVTLELLHRPDPSPPRHASPIPVRAEVVVPTSPEVSKEAPRHESLRYEPLDTSGRTGFGGPRCPRPNKLRKQKQLRRTDTRLVGVLRQWKRVLDDCAAGGLFVASLPWKTRLSLNAPQVRDMHKPVLNITLDISFFSAMTKRPVQHFSIPTSACSPR